MSEERHEGRCRCRAVRYVLHGPLLFCGHCHCESCRRSHSAPVVTWTAVLTERFELVAGADELTAYQGSSHATRRFCQRCGSPMTYTSMAWPGKVYVPVASLEEPPATGPQYHVNAEEAVPWCRIDDGLPRCDGLDDAPDEATDAG